MTRRLRIVIASAVVLVGLLLIVLLSVIGVTHTGFGQDRVRKMVLSMLEGSVKAKVYIVGVLSGFFPRFPIYSGGIRDAVDSGFFSLGPLTLRADSRGPFFP